MMVIKANKVKDYFKLYRELKNNPLKFENKIKIAVLSTFTVSQIEPIIFVENAKNGFYSQIYIPNFNQFRQEILNNKSHLYSFKPDIIFFILRIEDMVNNFFFNTGNNIIEYKNSIVDTILSIIEKGIENLNSTFILNEFFIPQMIPNTLFNFQELTSPINLIKEINNEIREKTKNKSNVYFYNVDYLIKKLGNDNVFDMHMDYYGSIPFKWEMFVEIGKLFSRFVKVLNKPRKKCLVLDLDNTLWGGVIGEDGISGIKLGGGYPGNVYSQIQKVIKFYKEQGIILAINSKNNFEDVKELFEKHSEMILKMEDFTVMRINWEDKVSNMVEISKELNIGLESMVFIDDNPVELDKMKNFLPEVTVIDFSSPPVENLKKLIELDFFDSLYLTEEDRFKTEEYKSRKKRLILKEKINAFEDFLKSLKVKVLIEKISEASFKRVYQLIHKTNQFNLTVKRHSEKYLSMVVRNGKKYGSYCVKVQDKFGDYGIVGVIIFENKDKYLEIDTFLLSCRALGLKIEEVMLAFLLQRAKDMGVTKILAPYNETKKNSIIKNFLKENGFLKKNEFIWKLSTDILENLLEQITSIKYEFKV